MIKITEANLTEITSYLLDKCVDSTMAVFNPPLWCQPTTEALEKVEIASTEMEKYRDDSLHFMVCAVKELKSDEHKQNAFAAAGARILDVPTQILMTTKLRNAIYPHHNRAGNGGEAHDIWKTFINDIG